MLLVRLPAVSVLEPKAVTAFACGLLFGPAALAGSVATLTLGAWRRGWPLAQGISMALLYTLVGLVAYLCFRPSVGLRRDIGDLRSYLGFLAAVAVGAAVLATAGSALLFRRFGFDAYWSAVIYWFGSAVTSLLVVAPSLLLVLEWWLRLRDGRRREADRPQASPSRHLGSALPSGVLAVGLVIAAVTVVVVPLVRLRPQLDGWLTLAYLGPILWSSLHHGLRGGLLSASASGVAYLVGTSLVEGVGPPLRHEEVVTQWAGLAVFSVVGAVTGAFQQERFRAETALVRSNRELQVRHQSLELLNHLADRLHRARDVDRIVGETVAELVRLHQPPRVVVVLREAAGETLRVAAQHGFDPAAVESLRRLPVSGGLNGLAMAEQRVLVSHDPGRDARVLPAVRTLLAKLGISSGVVIPLVCEGRALGAIDLLFEEHRPFADHELETFRAIGQTVALSIVSAERFADLEHQASHDSLTGLANRNALHQRVGFEALARGDLGRCVAFVLFDIDRFKEVNDALGHHLGDRLLTCIGPRVEAELGNRPAEIFRLGGDEFLLLLTQLEAAEEAPPLAGRLLEALRRPFEVDGLALQVGASAGIALFPEHGADSHELLRCADVAMYQAKRTAAGAALYDRDFDLHTPARLALAAALGRAAADGELRLHFQRKVDLESGKTVGFEALVRWQHPRLGLLEPGEFIPLAEVGDQIHPITYWVVEQALRHHRHWCRRVPALSMAVNLSARCLLDPCCPQRLAELVAAAGVDPSLIEVELTETALMSDPERAAGALRRIADYGVRLVIDDFGSGYSSLAYLRRFPVQSLKLDRSFVAEMLRDRQSLAIVRSTVQLGRDLGLAVVAEGVEDEPTAAALRDMGCRFAQGYHFARPVPAEQAELGILG